VTVRPAEPADAPGLARVFLESAAYHRSSVDASIFGHPEPGAVLRAYHEALAGQGAEGRPGPGGDPGPGPGGDPGPRTAGLLVAEVDGQVVGLVELRIEAPPADRADMHLPVRYGWVDELAVGEAWRRSGVGTRLLRAAEAWLRERGAVAVLLDTHPGNAAALDFYQERMGYRPVGVRLRKRLDGGAGP